MDHDLEIELDNKNVDRLSEGKYLGVVINDTLSFSTHISNISSKISKTIGIMYRIRSFVPESALLKLYYSLIYPYLSYCNVIWGDTHDIHLNKLLLLQKKAVRIITNSEFLASTTPLFL